MKRILNVNFWLPICIFLGAYVVPGTNSTSLGKILLFIVTGLLFVFFNRGVIDVSTIEKRMLLFYACYIFFDAIIVMFFNEKMNMRNMMLNTIMNIMSIFIIIVVPQYLNYQKFTKILTIIAVICIMGLLMQSFQVFVFGVKVSPIKIPFLSMATNDVNWAVASFRPESFFSEPQAYCSFIAPFIIIMLYKQKYFLAGLGSITMVLTTSTTGIFLAAAIWLYWVFFKVENVILKGACIILFVVVLSFVTGSVFFENTMYKLVDEGNMSRYERTSKGLEIFKSLPIKDKLLGVGEGNLENYIVLHQELFSDELLSTTNFVTSGFGNFVNYGLIGGCTYLILCVRMIMVKKHKFARLIAILILITSFTQTISFNNWGIWWFIIYEIIRGQEALDIKYREGGSISEGVSY